MANKSITLDGLSAKFAISVNNYEQLSSKHERIQKRIELVKSERLTVSNKVSLLEETSKDKEAKLTSLRSHLETLNDKYKNTIQEKSFIEGQFKQLQRSL